MNSFINSGSAFWMFYMVIDPFLNIINRMRTEHFPNEFYALHEKPVVFSQKCSMYHFQNFGSVALLSHFDKVLALSKFALLKCENEVNPIAWIPRASSTRPPENKTWGCLIDWRHLVCNSSLKYRNFLKYKLFH